MTRYETGQRFADPRARLDDARPRRFGRWLFEFPPLVADQGNEADIRQVLAVELPFLAPRDPHQFLGSQICSDRHHHPASGGELALQGFGDYRPARRHEYRIERRFVEPSPGAVRMQHVNIFIPCIHQIRRGNLGETFDTFDRIDLTRNLGQHGRRVTGPGADFEHLLAAPERQGLHHVGDDIRL